MREFFANLTELPVLRPEIMSPFADAMRLIHRQRHRFPLAQTRQKIRHHQPLRRHIQQLVPSLIKSAQSMIHLAAVQRGIDKRRRHPRRLQLIDLILHQRNQGRNHHRQSITHQRRQLIT